MIYKKYTHNQKKQTTYCCLTPLLTNHYNYGKLYIITIIIIIFIKSPISNVHRGTSSVDYITKCIYNVFFFKTGVICSLPGDFVKIRAH